MLLSDFQEIFKKIMNRTFNIKKFILIYKIFNSINFFFRDITNFWEKDAFQNSPLLLKLNSSVNKRKIRSRRLVVHVFCAHNYRVRSLFLEQWVFLLLFFLCILMKYYALNVDCYILINDFMKYLENYVIKMLIVTFYFQNINFHKP